MKRSGMPKRRTPLRADPQKTRDWQQKSRKRLPAKSARQRETDKARRVNKRKLLVAAGLTEDGRGPIEKACAGHVLVPEITCSSPFGSRPRLEMHEVVKRSRWPKGATVRSNCVLLCQAHHDFTEDFPNEATERGLLRSGTNVHPFDKFDAYDPEGESGVADDGGTQA